MEKAKRKSKTLMELVKNYMKGMGPVLNCHVWKRKNFGSTGGIRFG